MKNKFITRLVLAALAPLVFSACTPSSTNSITPGAPAAAATPSAVQGPGIEGLLAVGTLTLEGTDKAVTAEQAKTLLPLWKAINTLSSSDTTTEAELQAVYQQIQDAMTSAQLETIESLDMSGDRLSELMSEYGVEPGGPMVQRSSGDSNSQQGFPPGGLSGAGGPPNGGAGGGTFSSQAIPPDGGGRVIIQGEDGVPFPPDAAGDTQATPGAFSGTGRRMFGMNNLFVQPLITLLKERAGV